MALLNTAVYKPDNLMKLAVPWWKVGVITALNLVLTEAVCDSRAHNLCSLLGPNCSQLVLTPVYITLLLINSVMPQHSVSHVSDISKHIADFGQGLQTFSQRLEQDVDELKRAVACKPRAGRTFDA